MTYIIIGFVPLLVFTTTVFKTMNKYYVEERKKEMLSQANVISGHITVMNYLFDDSKKELFDYDIKETSRQGGYRIVVLDSMGTVVNDSNKTIIGKTLLIPEVVEALDNKDIAREQDNETVYAAVTIVDSRSNQIGAVLISDSTSDIFETIDNIRKQVIILLFGVVIISAIVMFFISQIITEPLKKMLEVIKKMSEGHLDQRVTVSGMSHNEISDLAEACNNMADELEQVESTRQTFVSNVSHELKTPLSSIKVLSESILLQDEVPKEMYVEFLKDINSEVDRMTEIINDLLTLVKLDQREIPIDYEMTDMVKLCGDVVKRISPLASAKNIKLEFIADKEVFAEVDSTKFTLAISNLVENGIKYTDEGGKVSLYVDCDHQNAFFKVTDTGIGIAEEELGKIFNRFYRVDKTRDRETGGTGLGLSITHSTVLMHNGSIKVTSKENEGTTFVVRIPLRHTPKVSENVQ
ncbi:MAG: HAMP domain-containing protein [Tyzzerella sp.]|uniref:histidine kinase n=1 Tax=Candidatus Fimicola merdigallinarum TaxID=2840819 RepID=A0A9D9DYK6_9FIRM|nr:HAMP domain-containing protein [Candidatus Fimicola merdigallinarum]